LWVFPLSFLFLFSFSLFPPAFFPLPFPVFFLLGLPFFVPLA
jgi:hypothetical protein